VCHRHGPLSAPIGEHLGGSSGYSAGGLHTPVKSPLPAYISFGMVPEWMAWWGGRARGLGRYNWEAYVDMPSVV
jgi:glycine/D-amino acid oxidase-like deaminating enzyme